MKKGTKKVQYLFINESIFACKKILVNNEFCCRIKKSQLTLIIIN